MIRLIADCAAATLYLLSAEGFAVKLAVALFKLLVALVNKPSKRVISVFKAVISAAVTPPATAC